MKWRKLHLLVCTSKDKRLVRLEGEERKKKLHHASFQSACRSKSRAQSLFIFIMASSHHLFHDDDDGAQPQILHEKSSLEPRILHHPNQQGNHAWCSLKSLKSQALGVGWDNLFWGHKSEKRNAIMGGLRAFSPKHLGPDDACHHPSSWC